MPSSFGPPAIDFGMLAQLGQSIGQAWDKRDRQQIFGDVGRRLAVTKPDYGGAAAAAFGAGEAEIGLHLMKLGEANAKLTREEAADARGYGILTGGGAPAASPSGIPARGGGRVAVIPPTPADYREVPEGMDGGETPAVQAAATAPTPPPRPVMPTADAAETTAAVTPASISPSIVAPSPGAPKEGARLAEGLPPAWARPPQAATPSAAAAPPDSPSEASPTSQRAQDALRVLSMPGVSQGLRSAALAQYNDELSQGRTLAAERRKEDAGKDEARVKAEAVLRGEFEKRIGTFNEVHDAYGRVIASVAERAKDPNSISPASDIAMIFGFMKMLDPGSVVRKGEYATAQNAAGVPDRIISMYNKTLNGEFLTPEQRQSFVSQANRLYSTTRERAQQYADRYGALAKGQKLDAANVAYLPPTYTAPIVGGTRTREGAPIPGGYRVIPPPGQPQPSPQPQQPGAPGKGGQPPGIRTGGLPPGVSPDQALAEAKAAIARAGGGNREGVIRQLRAYGVDPSGL